MLAAMERSSEILIGCIKWADRIMWPLPPPPSPAITPPCPVSSLERSMRPWVMRTLSELSSLSARTFQHNSLCRSSGLPIMGGVDVQKWSSNNCLFSGNDECQHITVVHSGGHLFDDVLLINEQHDRLITGAKSCRTRQTFRFLVASGKDRNRIGQSGRIRYYCLDLRGGMFLISLNWIMLDLCLLSVWLFFDQDLMQLTKELCSEDARKK